MIVPLPHYEIFRKYFLKWEKNVSEYPPPPPPLSKHPGAAPVYKGRTFLIPDANSCIDCELHIKDDPDLQ